MISLERPSAYLPVAMSMLALAVVLGHVVVTGVVHQRDEGAAAHVFQLLMTVQVPIVLFLSSSGRGARRGRACQCWGFKSGLGWLLAWRLMA